MEHIIKFMVVISIIIVAYACLGMNKIKRDLKNNKGWNYHDLMKGINMTFKIRVALILAYLLVLVCVMILMKTT